MFVYIYCFLGLLYQYWWVQLYVSSVQGRYHEDDGDEKRKRNDDVDHVEERLSSEVDRELELSEVQFVVVMVGQVSLNSRTSHIPDIYQ